LCAIEISREDARLEAENAVIDLVQRRFEIAESTQDGYGSERFLAKEGLVFTDAL